MNILEIRRGHSIVSKLDKWTINLHKVCSAGKSGQHGVCLQLGIQNTSWDSLLELIIPLEPCTLEQYIKHVPYSGAAELFKVP